MSDLNYTISLTDRFSSITNVIGDAMQRLGNAAGKLKVALAPLNSQLVSLAGAFAGFATVRKSIEEAEGAVRAADRLRIALGGSQRALEIIQRQAKEIAARTALDDDDIVRVAESLIQRGVPISKLQETIEAAVQTSQALRLDLDSTAEAIAKTFNGVPPREFRRQLAGLTEEQLRNGAAVARLALIYRGQAEAFTQTATGRQQAAIRDINNLLEDAGRKFIVIRDRLTVALIPSLEKFVGLLESPAGAGFLAFLTQAGEFLARNAVYVVGFVAALKGLELVGPITALFKGLYAVAGLIFSPAGLLVGGVTLGVAVLLELVKKITSLRVGVADVVDVVGDLWRRWRDGSLTAADLADSFLTDLKVLGTYFRTYLYDIPVQVVSNLLTQVFLKLDELVARAKVKFAELLNLPGASRVLGQFGLTAPDLNQARADAARAADASANAPSIGAGIAGVIDAGDAEVSGLRTEQTNRAIARKAERDKEAAAQARQSQKVVDDARLDQLGLDLDDRFKVEEDAEKKARERRDYLDDLEIRRLKARGEEYQAARLELEVKQRKELEEARDKKKSPDEIALLEKTQAEERYAFESEALAKQVAKVKEEESKKIRDTLDRESKARQRYDEIVRRSDALAQQGSISQREARERNSKASAEYKQTLDEVTAALEAEAQAASDPRVADELREKIVALREEFELLKPQIDTVGSVLRDSLQQPAEGAFKSIITGAKGAKEAFASMLQGFADNLAAFAAKKAVTGILDSVFGGAGGGSGGLLGSFFAIGLGEKRNAGGIIGGGGPDVDSVPALLTPGEYVVRRRSTQRSIRLLEGINAGAIDDSVLGGMAAPLRYATGGLVSSRADAGGGASTRTIVLPVQVADEPSFRKMLGASGDALADFMARDPAKFRNVLGV